MGQDEKHVFISYVRQDADKVDKLAKLLRAAEIPVWTDRSKLWPGDDWKAEIRRAIQSGSLAFLACFSEQSRARESSVQNEEINLAIDEYRKRAPGQTWLIPVRFDDGEVPEWDLGANKTIYDLNFCDLFGDEYDAHMVQLIVRIQEVMGLSARDPATVAAAIEQVDDAEKPAALRRITTDMIQDPAQSIRLDELIATEASRLLTSLRDPEKFPTSPEAVAQSNHTVYGATVATDYWRLVEPFCWSLQVSARFARDPATLRPWVNTLRSLCTFAGEIVDGYQFLSELRYVPALTATFVAAMASADQHRWDNFKTLLVDTTIPAPRYPQKKLTIVEAVDPYRPFDSAERIPNVLARSAVEGQTFEASYSDIYGSPPKLGGYYTPTADWMHHILRPVFDTQFPDDAEYDRAFDRTEVLLGVIAQDLAHIHTQTEPELRWLYHSQWFGRSRRRAGPRFGHPVEDLKDELATQETSWEPLAAGLFGGSVDRATDAIDRYSEYFEENRRWTM